jgi:hypothetical protein
MLSWAKPATITYGTALSATQLNASANVPGSFVYSPASGTLLNVGTHTLSTTFTPNDSANYTNATTSVSLEVVATVPSAPVITAVTSANGEATLTFTTPSSSGSSAITGYTILATASDGSIVRVTTTSSPAQITGLTPGKSYRFSITSNNNAGSSEPSPSTDTLTISRLNQSIAFATIADRTSNSGSFDLAAKSSSGLPVSYTVLSGPAMLAANIVDLTGATGTVKIRASQSGDATYDAAPDVEVSFAVRAGATQVILASARAPATQAVESDVALVLQPNSRNATILVVSSIHPMLNGTSEFQIGPGGTFSTTLTAVSTLSSLTSLNLQSDPTKVTTYTLSGTLTDHVLSGSIAPLGLVFTSRVPAPSSNETPAAGFYKSQSLAENLGNTYAVVDRDNQMLVLTNTERVITGGLTTLKSDYTYTLATTTSAGDALLKGVINPPTTILTSSLSLTSNTTVNFAGLKSTTTRTDRLINLSSRAKVGLGDSVLITGFVVGGPANKKILIRAVGPALSPFGLTDTLPNPAIKIYQGNQLIAENDDWNKNDAAEMARLGAFPLTSRNRDADGKDAALFITLAPGAYTAQISDPNGTGVALAEIYDASLNSNADYQRLLNISSRGNVTPDDGVLIGGFIVSGNHPKTLLVRGIGPALSTFGIAGALPDPVLTLYQENQVIATNTGWANRSEVANAASQTGAFALPTDSKDSALLITLNPGAYTAQIKSAKKNSSGIALIEIYEVP